MLLALDPAIGSKPGEGTGWALENGECGVRTFLIPSKLKGEERKAERAGRYILWLSDLLEMTGADAVIYEAVGHGGRFGSNGDLPPLIRAACWMREIIPQSVDCKTWRAWATARGLWSVEQKSDLNDAKAILAWGLAHGPTGAEPVTKTGKSHGSPRKRKAA